MIIGVCSLGQSSERAGDSTSPLSAPHEVREKLSLARFKLRRVVGFGSFAEVFLAQDLVSGSPVALKMMPKSLLATKKNIARLLSEKTILSELHHPLIVDFCGSFQDSQKLYLVLSFVPGGELFSLMNRRGILPCSEALFYAAELAEVLSFLHQQGIVFRDVKPENVLIGASGHIKLADFGFAKRLKESEKTYSLCGTPHFMAPEVISRSGHGFPSDWWSFGVILYEMLSGKCPFDGESPYELYAKIVSQPFKPLEGISLDAANLVAGLLTKDPERRLVEGEVLRHPFFKDISWSSLLRSCPPYVPEMKDSFDDSHFDYYESQAEEPQNQSRPIETLEGY